MDLAIKKHLSQNIREKQQLSGGFSFDTWLVILENEQKVVFRTAHDTEVCGGKKFIVSDILNREKFFYENVNQHKRLCPVVYVVDDTYKYFDRSFQISEYIDGVPLSLCFETFNNQKKDDILFKIGQITAEINNIEINKSHDYVAMRDDWECFFSEKLFNRLNPLCKSQLITVKEINIIINGMQRQKAERTFSFLHLDMRFPNIIYNEDKIFIVDAENCEFGDPLYELAIIDMTGNLTGSFMKGYKSVYNQDIIITKDLFYFYKMEREAALLNLFLNIIKTYKIATERSLHNFDTLKNKLLKISGEV